MTALTRVTRGENPASSDKLNQVIDAWNGNTAGINQGNSPVSLTAINDPINYAMALRNADAAGKGLIIYAPDGVTPLLRVDKTNGVYASPDGTTAAAKVAIQPITAAQLGTGAVGTTQLAANAVTQAGQGRGSGVTTTTSASYVDLGDMTVALTTTGGDLLCWMIVSVSNNAAGNAVDVAFKLDAATEVGDMRVSAPVANYDVVTKAIWRFTGVSAASHTVQGRWRTTAGTASADSVYRTMIVMEVKR